MVRNMTFIILTNLGRVSTDALTEVNCGEKLRISRRGDLRGDTHAPSGLAAGPMRSAGRTRRPSNRCFPATRTPKLFNELSVRRQPACQLFGRIFEDRPYTPPGEAFPFELPPFRKITANLVSSDGSRERHREVPHDEAPPEREDQKDQRGRIEGGEGREHPAEHGRPLRAAPVPPGECP